MKSRQSAFLVTKMRFASVSPDIFFNCRGWAGGFPASNLLFFIPLEIDVEGTEMASKRSKNAPPQKKTTTHFRVILTHHCMSVVGSPCSFRDFLEPYYGQRRPKRGPVSNKTAFKGAFCSTSNAGKSHFYSSANTHLPVLLRYHLLNFYPI